MVGLWPNDPFPSYNAKKRQTDAAKGTKLLDMFASGPFAAAAPAIAPNSGQCLEVEA